MAFEMGSATENLCCRFHSVNHGTQFLTVDSQFVQHIYNGFGSRMELASSNEYHPTSLVTFSLSLRLTTSFVYIMSDSDSDSNAGLNMEYQFSKEKTVNSDDDTHQQQIHPYMFEPVIPKQHMAGDTWDVKLQCRYLHV